MSVHETRLNGSGPTNKICYRYGRRGRYGKEPLVSQDVWFSTACLSPFTTFGPSLFVYYDVFFQVKGS